MVGLGDLPGGIFSSTAFALSGDGKVIVGDGRTDLGFEAFVWDEINGMRSIRTMLQDFGVDIEGWSFRIAKGVSYDGTVIIGNGTNPDGEPEGWIVTIPEPTILPLMALGILATVRRRVTT